MKKIIRKTAVIIAVVSALLLALTVNVFAADEPTIRLSSVENAKPGDTVEVTVSLENNPGVTCVLLRLKYDKSVLELKEIKDAGNLGANDHSPVDEPTVSLSWDNPTTKKNFTFNGIVATLIFEVKEGA